MVHFVGAGPGAADLITVRGKALIESADVIIYAGSLVNPALLGYAKQGCEIHNSASMTLEQVTEVMLAAEAEGKTTVRLHTGDPSVYGAVKEQMDMLQRHGIAFDVCPGVSSMFAAAAALKAEYTLPGVSQSLIVTRMAGRTAVPEGESIKSFASHGASMAIFLSAGMTKRLSEELINGGYGADTPAAIVYKASWEDEKVIKTTVGGLAESAEEHGITRTALILVGGFISARYNRSSLYDPDFSHGCRKGGSDI